MRKNDYVERLRAVAALAGCSRRDLARIASLVDTVELPAGKAIKSDDREVVITIEPTRVLVIERRALDAVLELAPALAAAG